MDNTPQNKQKQKTNLAKIGPKQTISDEMQYISIKTCVLVKAKTTPSRSRRDESFPAIFVLFNQTYEG